MMFIGIIAGVTVFELYFRRHLKERRRIFYLEMCLLAAVILGMAGAYLFQNFYNFIEDPSHFTWTWSLTFYGGLIMGVAVFIAGYFLFVRKLYPEGLSKFFTIFPASIALGHAFGRIGCFLEGCCYGVTTDAWFGVEFVTTPFRKVVPTNLFEAIFLFILFGVLCYLAFKKDCPFTMSIYMIAYGVWRFCIEFARGDHRGSLIPGLSPSQFWSILLVVGGVGLLIFILFRKKKGANEPQRG